MEGKLLFYVAELKAVIIHLCSSRGCFLCGFSFFVHAYLFICASVDMRAGPSLQPLLPSHINQALASSTGLQGTYVSLGHALHVHQLCSAHPYPYSPGDLAPNLNSDTYHSVLHITLFFISPLNWYNIIVYQCNRNGLVSFTYK